jgi:broad specificity phosphatase PhoE
LGALLATLYLIRHAKPAATYGDSVDPGLDDKGREQAVAAANELKGLPNRLPVYTSPLRRCRETAQPLADLWGIQPIVFPEIGEIPSPPLSLLERQTWLRNGMASDWANLQATAPAGSPDYTAWRHALVDALGAMAGDAVIFSHFIAINAAIGWAEGNEQVITFRPDHASMTMIDTSGGKLSVKLLGREVGASSDTSVLLGR